MSEGFKNAIDVFFIVSIAIFMITDYLYIRSLKKEIETKELLIEGYKRQHAEEEKDKDWTETLEKVTKSRQEYINKVTELNDVIFKLEHPFTFALKPGTIIKIAGMDREFVKIDRCAGFYGSGVSCCFPKDGAVQYEAFDIDHVEAILRNTTA